MWDLLSFERCVALIWFGIFFFFFQGGVVLLFGFCLVALLWFLILFLGGFFMWLLFKEGSQVRLGLLNGDQQLGTIFFPGIEVTVAGSSRKSASS